MKTYNGKMRSAALSRAWHVLALVVLMAGTIFTQPGIAHAATFTVTKTADTNDGACNADCSLREAIIAANATAGPHTITLPAGTYLITLTPGPDENAAATGDFDLLSSITINGAGAGSTIIDAQSADRVFDINPFGGCTCSITLSGLTIQNGKGMASNFDAGAGIFIGPNTTININNSTISANQAQNTTGGGIENRGALTLNTVTVQNNTAKSLGGGIYNIGSLTVTDSTFSGNKAESGGAIYFNAAPGKTASVTNSVFTSNQTVATSGGVEDSGGAIAISTDNAVTLNGNVFSGNSAVANGGAIYFADSATDPAVASLTMSYNRIAGNTVGIGFGGNGVYRASGTATAQKNWWGCNGGPSSSFCDSVSGTVNYTPWMVLRLSSSPGTLSIGQAATLDADFLSNSDASTNLAGNLGKIVGTPITFGGAVLGTLSGAQTTIQSNGHATALYTANTAGAGSANATVDNQTLTANFTNLRSATAVSSISRTSASPTNAASVSWTVVFTANVTGLSASNFTLAASGLSGTSITGVGGSGANWVVTATTGTGAGTFGLNLTNDTGVDKSISNAAFTGQVYSVDRVAPDTTITGNPTNPSLSSSATFTFTGSDTGTGVASFECKLDSGGFSTCISPQTYSGLNDGSHIFQVRAVDGVGNVDPTPAAFTWVVDTTAPDTTINSHPSDPSNSASANFTFSGNDSGGSGVASFECKLDSGSFATCTSPQSYSGLSEGSHTFQVRAKDAAGNVDPSPASFTWLIDITAPDTTITDHPTNPSPSSSATFTFTGSDGSSGVASFECQIDSGGFSTCTSPKSYNSLSDGSHTFQVRARDAAGNVDPTPASFTWVIDSLAPETTITSTPSNPTNSTSARFEFTSSKPNSTFECKLDSGSFASCTSPQSYSSLADGSHTFTVRATDALGNVDPSPASFTWQVDTTAPDTSINSHPSDPSNSASANFTFSGNDGSGSGVASFECKLDSGSFAACTSPKSYSGLSDGSHIFQVRAIDGVGNVDPTPASFTWVIDTTPPDTSITGNPSNPSNSANASFNFTGTDAGSGVASFECKLDAGSFAACSSPQSYNSLSDGSHTFQVRARDAAGNIDPTPASFTWVIDATPPDTTITDHPANPSLSSSATFTFTGSDGGTGVASFQCQLDGAGFAACTSPQSYTGLADGSHTFQVRAVDTVGNVDPSPASFTWVIDTTAPDTTITSNPSNPTNSTSATFVFTGTDSGTGVVSFECKLDSGSFAVCTSPKTFNGLSDGSHTFAVRAIDGVGNVDPSPAAFTWTIDTVAPSVTINQASVQADPTMSSPIHFTVVFSEPVVGFDGSKVTLAGNAGATTAVVTETAPNDGTTYDVAVSGMITDGDVIASIALNKVTDLAGNGNKASTSTDNSVTYHVNRAPMADAGAPQTVTAGTLVTLTGVTSSDPENQALTFGWSQVSGTPVTLDNASAVSPTFTAPNVVGMLVFQLVVTDSMGLVSAPAVVTVTVTNSAPTADAGAPQTVYVNTSVTLNGSVSSDPENQALTFGWSQVSGASVTLDNASAVSPTFTAPAITGTLVFQLVVTDSLGAASAPAFVTITVVPAPVIDIPPGDVTITLTTGIARLQPSSDFTATIITGTEPITFVWDFGDGSPLFYGPEASHVYAPGHYTATLTATNSAGTVTSTIRVFVPHRLLLSLITKDAIMPRSLPPR